MADAHDVLWLLLGMALVISVMTDILRQRILDVVTYPTLALGLGIRLLAEGPGTLESLEGLGGSGFLSGALGAAVVGGTFALFAWRGKMGWGDAKLGAAVGACLGLYLSLSALLFISLVGALQALVALLWAGALFSTFSAAVRGWAERLRLTAAPGSGGPGGPGGPAAGKKIPYGVAIALGTFWAMWWDHASRG